MSARIKTTKLHVTASRYLASHLKFLGVPKELLAKGYSRQVSQRVSWKGSFWNKPLNFLEILETARDLFLSKIKRHFVNGQCSEYGRRLIAAWTAVKLAFAKKGVVLE